MLLRKPVSPVLSIISVYARGSEFGLRRSFAKGSAAPLIGSLGKKTGKGKGGPVMEKKVLPVETDTTKLSNYLCGSCITKTGEDVKLGSDAEYPEWLWKINTGKPLPLEELDPNTEYYWRRAKKIVMTRKTALLKLKKF